MNSLKKIKSFSQLRKKQNMIDYFTIIKTFLCFPTDLFFTALPESIYEKKLWGIINKNQNNEKELNIIGNEIDSDSSKKEMDELLYYFGETIMSNRLENFIISKKTENMNDEIRTELIQYRPMKYVLKEYPFYFCIGSIIGLVTFFKLPSKSYGLLMFCNTGNIGYFCSNKSFKDYTKKE